MHRHGYSGRKLGRERDQRRALLKGLADSLIKYESIETTLPKAKPSDVTRKWYVLDASQVPLGRLSTVAAKLLTGKDKPMFTHHIDTGDFVIVINADQLIMTGQKADQKMYYSHSQYPGGLREQ